jgi:tetratricopeptide (TPR) repeat protein
MSDTTSPADTSGGDRAFASVTEALNAGNLSRAMDLSAAALTDGWRHPLFFNLSAHRLERAGDFTAAAGVLEQGLLVFPNDLELLTALGMCLSKTGQARQSVAAFDTVLQAMPDFAPAHHGKAEALERLADFEGAERHYRAAVDLMPDFVESMESLAGLLSRTGRAAEARELAQRTLDVDPSRIGAKVALAYCNLADGDPEAAEAIARPVVDDPSADPEPRAAAAIALGDALDGQGRFGEAFAAYEDGARRLAAVRAAGVQGKGETYFDVVERIIAWLSQLEPTAWTPNQGTDEPSPAANHAFIISATARSGATLLKRTLAGHPGVAELNDSESLAMAEREFLLTPGGLERLAELSAADGRRLRSAYWARARSLCGDLQGKALVDRAPLGAATLVLIAALFPKAKIVLALRDPRDAVLANFRKPFMVNPDLHPFMTLEGAARLYDAAMRLLDLCWEKLPVEIAEERQEDLFADPEGETKSLCAFLGVDWDTAMAGAATAAKGDESRWRDYAAELAPVLPILKPWIERFGYSED